MNKRASTIAVSLVFATISIAGIVLLYGDPQWFTRAMGTTASLGIFAAAYFLFERVFDRYDRRQSLTRITRELSSESVQNKKQKIERIFAGRNRRLERFTERFEKLFNLGGVDRIRRKLLAAGKGDDKSVFVYVVAKTALPVIAGVVSGAASLAFTDKLFVQLAATLTASSLFFYGAERILKNMTDRRRKHFENELPDIIDLLVIYTESGKSFDNAISHIIDRASYRYPTVSRELYLLQRDFQFGSNRNQAYDDFVDRVGLPTVSRLVSVLKQAERIGSPISETLKTMSTDSRRDRMMRAEQKAARIPIIIQLPIVLFIMPAIFLIVLGPAAFRMADAFSSVIKGM